MRVCVVVMLLVYLFGCGDCGGCWEDGDMVLFFFGWLICGIMGMNWLCCNDWWIVVSDVLCWVFDFLVVDLGYGVSGVIVFELVVCLVWVCYDVEVFGFEIDLMWVVMVVVQFVEVCVGCIFFVVDLLVLFVCGGFEVLFLDGWRVVVICVMNVLWQYDEQDVFDVWVWMMVCFVVDGFLFEGMCDEIGCVVSWIDIDVWVQLQWFMIFFCLVELEWFSIVVECFLKVFIYCNVLGEWIYVLFVDFDCEWDCVLLLLIFGVMQCFFVVVGVLCDQGWLVMGGWMCWCLGEFMLFWVVVVLFFF